MYKNQLQELAQRSCFNLPSYTCIREGPDHAPRFKAAVNFNGETFESPSYCFTLRQAEHSAAEVALNALSGRGPSNSLAARILDETGVYKNLLQEVSQRVGASLPVYTTFRTGLGHLPVFTCTVELASVMFTGDPAKNKKQAEKNAAMTAWLSLKSLVRHSESSTSKKTQKDEPEHVTVARALQKYLVKAKLERESFPIKFPALNSSPSGAQQSPATTSKILPLICPKLTPRNRHAAVSDIPSFQKICKTTLSQPVSTIANESHSSLMTNLMAQSHKFPAAGEVPYIPVRHCNPHQRIAPPVTIRNAIPVFSAPPLPSPHSSLVARPPISGIAPPVRARQAAPVFAASPVRKEELQTIHPAVKVEDPLFSRPTAAQLEQPPLSRAVSGRLEESPFFKLPMFRKEELQIIHPAVKVEDPLFSRPTAAQLEQPPLSRAVSGRLEESPFFKLPMFRGEEPLGPKLLPVCVTSFSELPAVQVEPPTFELPMVQVQSPVSVASSLPASSKASAKETRIAVQDMLQESAEIKGLNELKI